MSLLRAALVLACVGLAHSYPDGAPVDVCAHNDMRPKHGASARAQPPETIPYAISLQRINGGAVITIDSLDQSVSFKGFLVQAYQVDGRGQRLMINDEIGQFAAEEHAKPLRECAAVTHTNSLPKKRVVLQWRGSTDPSIRFFATVARSFEVFWVGQPVSEVFPLTV